MGPLKKAPNGRAKPGRHRRLVRVLEEWSPYCPGFHLDYPVRRQIPAALPAFIDFFRGECVVS